MSEKISTTHSGVEIEYVEDANRWEFDLDGRHRHAASLEAAKKAIDEPPKVPRKKAEPISALFFRPYHPKERTPVWVTSVDADSPSHFWIKEKKSGRRSKESQNSLALDNADSAAIFAQIDEFELAKEKLSKKVEGLRKELLLVCANDLIPSGKES